MAKIAGEALFLGTRTMGENGHVALLFGQKTGLLRGLTRQTSGIPGDTLRFEHTRRLDSQLGRLTYEVAISRAAFVFADTAASLVMGYLTELLPQTLPDEHPYPALYEALNALWQDPAPWWKRLALFERELLAAIGYGLSLAEDAVPCPDGSALMYVSPRTGRAVSQNMGAPYADKLLVLPALWGGAPLRQPDDGRVALDLTGHFLQQALHGKPLASRHRVVEHVCSIMTPREISHATPACPDDPVLLRRHGS